MNQTTTLLDPTAERAPSIRQRLTRPRALDGLTVGIVDISKARGNVFLDRIDEQLASRNITVKRYSKPTFTRVASTALKQQIATECDLVIEGLAD